MKKLLVLSLLLIGSTLAYGRFSNHYSNFGHFSYSRNLYTRVPHNPVYFNSPSSSCNCHEIRTPRRSRCFYRRERYDAYGRRIPDLRGRGRVYYID